MRPRKTGSGIEPGCGAPAGGPVRRDDGGHPETAGTGCMMSPQRRSLIDMDCPDPRLFTMTKAANLPFSPGSYDTDSVFERFEGRPFDSTLKTGAGGDSVSASRFRPFAAQ